ncbi:MAG: insulinase family protein [Planctomycetes bacterium]|nr:insulinase family protein [Planctomycetota bacterium]
MRTRAKSLLFLICAVAALAAASAVAQEAPKTPAKGLDVAEYTLDNGLKLLVVNRPGVPIVSSYVWYKVGSMDEDAGRTGMAHFLEHMMFKGSREYRVGDVDGVCQRNGGSNNAFTSNDYTAYYINLPKSRYAEALKIEADRMRHLTLDLKEFDSEKQVVQSESDISADDPSSRLWERLSGAVFGHGHPYSHPVLGWPQDVQDTSRRDMRLFYEKHYYPNHATLVLAGDITGEEALKTVRGLFGDLPRGPEPARPQPIEINFRGPVTIEEKGDSEVVQLISQYLTVRAGQSGTEALDVLGIVLGGGVTSRLYRELVDKRRVATSAGAGHYSQMLAGSFYVTAELAEGHTREELLAGINDVVRELAEKGPTADELERARNRVVASSVFERESADQIAASLGSAETAEGDWRRALNYPDRIAAVKADDVRSAAQRYLKAGNCAMGWLVPELSPAGQGPAGADAQPQALPIQRHVLPNGVTVLLLERKGQPVVSVEASVRSYRTGETASEAGLNSFTGLLLDTGTAGYSKQQLAEAMENVGGELSASAAGGEIRVLKQHTDLGLRLLAEVLQRPTFPAEEIELARAQVLANLEAAKDDVQTFGREAAAASVYGASHPMGRPAFGNLNTVAGFTREQVAAWHKRWFRPDNCVIAAVGDFDAPEMLKKLQAEFGGWQKPAEPLVVPQVAFAVPASLSGEQVFHFASFDPAQVKPGCKRVMVDHPEKDQVAVRLVCLGVERANPDYYALLVMDNILGTGAGFTDRFSKTLRDKMGLAYSTSANITGGAGIYPGTFQGYIGTRPENVELSLKTMYELIAQIRTEKVGDDELRAAKDYLKGSFVFGLETSSQLAGLLISIERFNLGADYMVKYTQAVEAVTPDDIQRVATKYLVPERMVEVLAGPVTRITPAGTEGEGK